MAFCDDNEIAVGIPERKFLFARIGILIHIFFNRPADAIKAVPDGLPVIRSEVQKQSVSRRDILIDHGWMLIPAPSVQAQYGFVLRRIQHRKMIAAVHVVETKQAAIPIGTGRNIVDGNHGIELGHFSSPVFPFGSPRGGHDRPTVRVS